jgi:Fic family protein
VLFLVKEGLLDSPVLYMSRYIVRTKPTYYQLLQAVRDEDRREEWVLYMLTAVEETARDGIAMVSRIKSLLFEVKRDVRDRFRFYSQDLINNLFRHPYTRIQFIEDELGVSRLTATRYLDALTEGGVLTKLRVGRANLYVNHRLTKILTEETAA